MTQVEKLRAQLVEHEDLRLVVYDDATGKPLKKGMTLKGHPTIGVGRNVAGKGLTKVEALYLLENDIAECVADLMLFPWFADLDPVRQRVMVDLRFNLGPVGFRAFKRTLRAVDEGRYGDAADHLRDSKWYGQVGNRGPRLVAMLRTGIDMFFADDDPTPERLPNAA